MAGRALLLLLTLGVSATGAEKDPKEEPEFKGRVNAAIEKGLAWLLTRQNAIGRFPAFEDARGDIYPLGMHALATLALLKGGHEIDSTETRSALGALFKLVEEQQYTLKTYEVALALMVLEAKACFQPAKDRDKGKKPPKPNPESQDLEVARRLVSWLQSKQQAGGLWRYPEDGVDLSNTQYAILGLWAAHRIGVEVDKGVVRRCVEGTMARQQTTGPEVERVLKSSDPRYGAWMRTGIKDRARGWRYMPDFEKRLEGGAVEMVTYPFSGSMTTAGIAVLAIGREILGKDFWLTPERDRKLRQSLYDGFAWLDRNWDIEDNPGQRGNWPFYWLYGLERAARLASLENVGPHDWYFEGAMRLLADQREDGSWPRKQRMRPPKDANVRWWSDQVDTAFALLFLLRTTPDLKIPAPVVTPAGD
ncbi:MAG: hypothetical protein ACT4PV_01530 [Planctomycetaceae bacterium]